MDSVVERLEARSIPEPNSGCLLWTGNVGSCGYGVISMDGRRYATHRLVWELANGPIPKRMCVCHKCDVPSCINIDHLWLGTHRQNMDDRTNKNRGYRALGRDHGRAVLTETQVLAIRADKRSTSEIASSYGVTKANVYAIKNRFTWKHLLEAA